MRTSATAMLTALALLVAPASGFGSVVIGVENWTPGPAPATPPDGLDPAKFAASMAAFVESEIWRLLDEDAAFKTCPAKLTEMVRRGELTNELIFQNGPFGDPATALPIGNDLKPTHVIRGIVAPGGSGHDYTIEVVDQTGKVTATFTGRLAADDAADRAADLARDILKRLCVKPAVQVKAAYNDLVINQKVCDLTKTFELNGTGATAGIFLTMQPASADGGSFTLAGTGGGVPWSGGGNYTLVLDDSGGGKLSITGTWKITTPVGVFSDSGTIPGTVTALPEPCKDE